MNETNGYSVQKVAPVEYIEHMGSDDAVCDAARVSFDKSADGFTGEQNSKLLRYLAKHEHWSPFAHCFIKLRMRAPIFIARQFQKHVVGFAWNEVSRRYVDGPPWFYVPDVWRKRPSNMKQGSTMDGHVPVEGTVLEEYIDTMRDHIKDYRTLVSHDVCPEQVRMLMPQSMMTEWIWSGSLMAWQRFVKLRSSPHAQQECHEYAHLVDVLIDKHFPKSADAFNMNKDLIDAG